MLIFLLCKSKTKKQKKSKKHFTRGEIDDNIRKHSREGKAKNIEN